MSTRFLRRLPRLGTACIATMFALAFTIAVPTVSLISVPSVLAKGDQEGGSGGCNGGCHGGRNFTKGMRHMGGNIVGYENGVHQIDWGSFDDEEGCPGGCGGGNGQSSGGGNTSVGGSGGPYGHI